MAATKHLPKKMRAASAQLLREVLILGPQDDPLDERR